MKVFDANTVLPEPLTITVGKKKIEIGLINMRTSLKIYKAMNEGKKSDYDTMLMMTEIVSDVLSGADTEITKDYLLDNLDTRQLAPIFKEIMEHMSSLADEKKPVPETAAPAV